jgi:DNA-directed RNA polymerase subunit K/omega
MDETPTLKGEEVGEMFDARQNRYFLVNVVSRRSKQLIGGQPTMVSGEYFATPLDAVCAEMRDGKLAVREEGESGVMSVMRRQAELDEQDQ